MDKFKPCPYCGSSTIRKEVHLHTGDTGEYDVDVIECLDCDAVAPERIWNCRVNKNELSR